MSIYSSALEQGEAIGRKKGEAIGRKKGEAIGREKGEVIGRKTGLQAMVQALKGFLPDAESIWKIVIGNDAYKDVSLGEIKRLYQHEGYAAGQSGNYCKR